MGIFSFFSRDTEEDDDELELEQPSLPGQQTDSAPTGELFEGMRVEVMTKEGSPLLSGRITERTDDTLTLSRLPGELSFKITPLNSAVNLSEIGRAHV